MINKFFFALVVIFLNVGQTSAIEESYIHLSEMTDGSKFLRSNPSFPVILKMGSGLSSAWIPQDRLSVLPERPLPPVVTAQSGASQDNRQPDWLLLAMGSGLIALQGLDLYTTYRAFDLGAVEGNPLMQSIIENPPLAVGVKVGITPGVLGYAYFVNKQKPWGRPLAIITLGVVDALMLGVVVNNFYVINQLSQTNHQAVMPGVVSLKGSF